mgnify:CR=1 FL=1
MQTTYALWTVLAPQLGQRANTTSLRVPTAEFAILVVPLLLSLTVLGAHPLKLNLALAALVVLCRRSAEASKPPALSPVVQSRAFSPKPGASPPPPPTRPETRLFLKPFVTVYRAHMMLMTVICILAVDFNVFPREFAKAETWGTSIVRCGLASASRLEDAPTNGLLARRRWTLELDRLCSVRVWSPRSRSCARSSSRHCSRSFASRSRRAQA